MPSRRHTRRMLMTLACSSAASHSAFHSHSCRSYAAIRNLTSLLCNMPQAPKPLSIHTHLCVCVCCVHVCVSNPVTLSECKHFHVFASEIGTQTFFFHVRLLPMHVCVYACTYERKMLSPGMFLLLILPSSASSWHYSFSPKAVASYL